MKNNFGFPANVGHLSAVNALHKISGLYDVSFAYKILSSPWDKTMITTQSLSS